MSGRRFRDGRLVLRTRPGYEFEHIGTHRDVRAGRMSAALGLDGGGDIDQLLRQRTPALLVTRAFYARRALSEEGLGHQGWDELEHALGLSRTYRVSVDPSADVHALAAELQGLEAVELAAPQYLCEQPPPESVERYGAKQAEADNREMRALIRAEGLSEDGDPALIVGLVDSGVALHHPELEGVLRPGVSSVGLRKEERQDGITILEGMRASVQDVDDDAGHGTFCAGLLAARGRAMSRGLAARCPLLPGRALCAAMIPGRERPAVLGSIEDINSCWKTLIDLGARVLNLSFGTRATDLLADDPTPHVELVRYALAHDCVLVAAAGNAGDEVLYYPAALPGVIAVGSVNIEGQASRFSSRGRHVAISAPGERVVSAMPGGAYACSSGTSFAAPLVAGAAALLVSSAAKRSNPITPEAVRDLLVESATPFRDRETEGLGSGVLDISAALTALERAQARAARREAA